MPNLVPPVMDVPSATAYHNRIMTHAPDGFTPVMTLYLTDNTDQKTVLAAKQSSIIEAFKLYPAGATTNSAFGVSTIKAMYPLFEAMESHDVILSIHGEVTDHDIDIFDREAVFIDTMLTDIVASFPKLRIILEHITTLEAVQFVESSSNQVAATITSHHLLFNRNDMLVGGIKPIHYCLPILKRDLHREALLKAATSGNPSFFLGTDSAPHPRSAKENACGCAAGCYTAHAAIELYAEAFKSIDRLDRLEGFASEFGADFYRYPRNNDYIELTVDEWTVPESLAFGNDNLIPTRGGETITFTVTDGARYPLSGGSG
jgi:dihydroorotase